MGSRFFGLALGLCFFAPLSASAQAWWLNCNSDISRVHIGPGEWVCFDPSANTDESPIVDVSGCENVDYFLFDDKDGDATVCTVTWEIEACPVKNSEVSASATDAACEILAGTAALSGDDAESNIAGIFIRVKGDGAGSNAGDCRIMAKCAERAN